MRIVCPSCSAAYEVPDSLMTAGRVVRCARCSGEWTPVAETVPESEPDAAPVPVESPVLRAVAESRRSAMDRLAAHPAQPSRSPGLRVAWGISILLLILAIGAAFIWHSQIMAAWPPSARAYAVFGLHPDTGKPP